MLKRRTILATAATALLISAFYAPLATRGFASEDFTLIRTLSERPPWTDFATLFTEPWLGIEVVGFYRPIAELLLGAEVHLFGGISTGYNLSHWVVHLLNTLLVYLLARRLIPGEREARQAPALGSAILFALHPLHPNAVSWIASYATPFAAAFVLGSALAWELWRRRGGSLPWIAALGLYTVGLGCYEAALVLPAALICRELLDLVPDGADGLDDGSSPRTGLRLLGLTPFFAVGIGYLGLRQAVLGQMVGGYTSFGARLAEPGRLAADALTSLFRLVHPAYGSSVPLPTIVAAVVLVATGPAILLSRISPHPVRATALWSYGWLWTLLFLAPFTFQPPVPASGRFAYLAVVGLALAFGVLTAGARRRPLLRATALALPILLGAHWALLLAANVGTYRQAGELAKQVSSELAATSVPGTAPVFVADHPRFLFGPHGVRLAQVLRYGLADSQKPPFRSGGPIVYPLPDPRAAGPLVAHDPDAIFLGWNAESGDFRTLAPTPPGTELAAAGPMGRLPDGTAPSEGWEVVYEPFPGARLHRLVVLTEGNPAVLDLRPDPSRGPASARMPAAHVRSMRHLYGSPVYWWVEAIGPGGRLLAASRPREWG